MRSWINWLLVMICVGVYGISAVNAPILAISQLEAPWKGLDYHISDLDLSLPEPKMCKVPEGTKLALLDVERDQPGFEFTSTLDQIDEYREPKDLTPLATAAQPKKRPDANRNDFKDSRKPVENVSPRKTKPNLLSYLRKRTVTGNGGRLILEPRTMRMFQQLEREWGEQLTVRWAYRDKKLNKRVGGAGRSMHLQKKALDIVHGGWPKAKMARFVKLAYKIGFRGFGLGSNVIHLDTRPGFASWNYGGNRYGTAARMIR